MRTNTVALVTDTLSLFHSNRYGQLCPVRQRGDSQVVTKPSALEYQVLWSTMSVVIDHTKGYIIILLLVCYFLTHTERAEDKQKLLMYFFHPG